MGAALVSRIAEKKTVCACPAIFSYNNLFAFMSSMLMTAPMLMAEMREYGEEQRALATERHL